MKILEGEEIATKSTEAMKVQSSLWEAESPCPEICASERCPQNEVPLCDLGHQGSIWTLAHTRWKSALDWSSSVWDFIFIFSLYITTRLLTSGG